MKYIFFILVFCSVNQCFTQNKYQANWCTGGHGYISFNSNNQPISSDTCALQAIYPRGASEGFANISDKNGNLIFYTDGITVYKYDKSIIATGLKGDSSTTQSAIIIPVPNSICNGDFNKYIIFTLGPWGNVSSLNYSVLDVSNFSIVAKNLPVPGSIGISFTEKMGAIKKNDDKSFYLVTQRAFNENESPIKNNNNVDQSQFFVWNISCLTQNDFGISSPDIQNVGSSPVKIVKGNKNANTLGYMKFSPNGKYLACANYGHSKSGITLYDFNLFTGKITNERSSNEITTSYGIEFSPNSKYIFMGGLVSEVIAVYNITAGGNLNFIKNISLEPLLVNEQLGSWGSYYRSGASLLGADNNIYIARPGRNFLDVIKDPDSLQTYISRGYYLYPNAYVGLGLPTFYTSPTLTTSPDSLSISGVVHQNFAKLSKGNVVLYNVNINKSYSNLTDSNGYFIFTNLSTGKYILKALPNNGDAFKATFYPNYLDSLFSDILTLGGSISEIDLYMMNTSVVDTNLLKESITVAPNPFGKEIQISVSKNSKLEGTIRIVNVYGEVIKEYIANTTNVMTLDTSTINSGIYILHFDTNIKTNVFRVIKP